MSKRSFLKFVGLGLACLSALPVMAQSDYPSKPIKLIVSFPPGGTSDMLGRMMADELGKVLKQPVIVDNIAGAGGIIGTDRAVHMPADGYTLIQTGVGQNAIAHGFDPHLKYNSLTDFIHLTQVNSGPNVFVVHPSTPFKTLNDVVEYAKKNPGKLDYGYTHAASGHMAMELFKQTAGIDMTGIPYKGGGPMVSDLLGGTIPTMFLNQDVVYPYLKAGKLRALAVTSAQRNPLLPDVPTVAESGYKGFQALSWSGISVAKGTPPAIVDKLQNAVNQVMQSEAVKQKLNAIGFVVPAFGSAHYTAFVKSEIELWTRVIKQGNIKPE